MEAFSNDPKIKAKYLARVKAHRLADDLVQGTGWANGKGCAVGCTLEIYEHSRYETELGIPEWLAYVEDEIFEELDENDAMLWPEIFLSAINPGADLNKIKGPFLIFILQSILDTFDHKKYPEVLQIINSVIDLWTIGGTEEDFKDAARSAAQATCYATCYATGAAADIAAADAAYAADIAAACDAAAVARVARAAYAADTAACTACAGRDARAARLKYSDKLIELLKACK